MSERGLAITRGTFDIDSPDWIEAVTKAASIK